ncbi:MAG: hypothetical protein AAFP10_06300 [Pseudomonadota bacterium]
MFDWFAQTFSEMQIYQWEVVLGDWFFVASIALLLIERIRYTIKNNVLAICRKIHSTVSSQKGCFLEF